MPGWQRPARIRASPCATSVRLIRVEPHDVGHGPERDQIEEGRQIGRLAIREHAALAQECARGRQHVEHHTDAGQVLAGERAARLVRIDDQRRRRQRRGGQVMVGDQHVDAARDRRSHAVVARDAVVDCHDQARHARCGVGDDLGRESVAVVEAVRHEEVDVGTERRESAHGDRAGSRAVGVVVGDDDDALARDDRIHEPRRRAFDALEERERREPREVRLELGRGRDAARGEHAGEHRIDARGGERLRCRRHVAPDNVDHARSRAALNARARSGRASECMTRRHGPGRRAVHASAPSPPSAMVVAVSRSPRASAFHIGCAHARSMLARSRVEASATTTVRAPIALASAASSALGSRLRRSLLVRGERDGDPAVGERPDPVRGRSERRRLPAFGKPDAVCGRLAGRLARGVHRVSVQQHFDLVLPAPPQAGIRARRQEVAQHPSGREGKRARRECDRAVGADEPRIRLRNDEGDRIRGEMRIQRHDQRGGLTPVEIAHRAREAHVVALRHERHGIRGEPVGAAGVHAERGRADRCQRPVVLAGNAVARGKGGIETVGLVRRRA